MTGGPDFNPTSPVGRVFRALKEMILQRTIMPGIGYRIHQRTNGVCLEILANEGGSKQGPGVHYEGEWDPDKTYTKGAWVHVTSGDMQGWFLLIVDSADENDPPVWPMPSATGGTDKWKLTSHGSRPTPICSPDGNTMNINASKPYNSQNA